MSELRMYAYYYGFGLTGAPEIDMILSAVACAGKSYHHTDQWNEEADPRAPHAGNTPVEWIQNAATIAAEGNKQASAEISRLQEENDQLVRYLCTCRDCGGEGSLHTGDWHSYSPMESPEPVMEKCGECDGIGLLGEIQDLYQLITDRDQLSAEVDDLKTENIRLTEGCSELRGLFADAAEQCCKAERERDQLKAENEALKLELKDFQWGASVEAQAGDEARHEANNLRKDAERYRWLRNAAEPSDWEYISHQQPDVVDIEVDAAMLKEQKD